MDIYIKKNTIIPKSTNASMNLCIKYFYSVNNNLYILNIKLTHFMHIKKKNMI